jgi:transaldolase
MKIYLDSAHVEAWKLPAGCPAIQGVTTNPSLVFQAGLSVNLATYLQLIQAAADHGMAELMLQLPYNDTSQALQWLAKLRGAANKAKVRLTIKLPCHTDWLPTISAVQAEGQAILLTGLSNPVQLLWARSLKADFVAPYVGRLAADGRDVWPFMQACINVQNERNEIIGDKKGPALLAASIKSPEVLTRLIACGAAAATLPPASLVAWLDDVLTNSAMSQFERDTAESLKFSEK